MNYKRPKVTLLQTSPLFVSEIGARVCYDSFNMSENDNIKSFGVDGTGLDAMKVQDISSSDVLDKLVWAFHHESIAEHTSVSFFVEDLSREILQELARHRVGVSLSVKSTRYTIEKLVNEVANHFNNKLHLDINNPEILESYNKIRNIVADNIVVKDDAWIDIETNALMAKLHLYHLEEPLIAGLTGTKKKKQNDRVKRCLPETWTTKLVITFNLRSFKHFVDLRDSGAAYFGIRELTEEMTKLVPEKYMRLIKKPKDLKEVEGH